MATQHLQGKVALVTGAGNGIGRGVALTFAAQGAKVVVNDYGGPTDVIGKRDTSAGEAVVAEIRAVGGEAVANAGNVASHAEAQQMVQQALDTYGDLDIVVCCAGILRERMVFNMAEDEWDDVVAVHLKGHFNVTKFASQHFRTQRKGRLIYFSSGAMFGSPGQPNYAAAKGGILSFGRSCANALTRYNVTCNVILPLASTRLMDRTGDAQRQIAESGKVPSERNQGTRRDPINIAPFVTYLATDAAQHVNGQAFGVRGYEVVVYSHPAPKYVFESENDQPWEIDRLVERVERELKPQLEDPEAGRLPRKWRYDVWEDEPA